MILVFIGEMKEMKKICFINYVFGEKYQQFIPIYLFFLFQTYPDADAKIYLDGLLLPQIKSALEKLEKWSQQYVIIENYRSEIQLPSYAYRVPTIQKSYRWLINDSEFYNYVAVYIGDIDILICKEEKSLYEQHVEHCSYLNLPFSNIVRNAPSNKIYNFRFFLSLLYRYGIGETIAYYTRTKQSTFRLSGLHFILVKPYFEKIYNSQKKYWRELKLLANRKSKKYRLSTFNNEAMLYDMLSDAGYVMPASSTGEPYNIETNTQKIAFRPHHGIHLGVFRSIDIMKAEKEVISSAVYKAYYKYFLQVYQTYFNVFGTQTEFSYLNNLLERMRVYYEGIHMG